MSLAFFAQNELNFATVHALAAGVAADEGTQSWESLTYEIRRLFRIASMSTEEARVGKTFVAIAAERILDATASMALIAEAQDEGRGARLTFLEQCEQEAQRLFDACMDGQQAAVLCAYAERGLARTHGLTESTVAVSH